MRILRIGFDRIVFCLALALAVSSAANAGISPPLTMTGKLLYRTGNSSTRIITAVNKPSGAFASPSQLALQPGGFTAAGTKLLFFPFFAPVAQVQSTFTTSQPTTHVFGAGAGPGAFTFCPLVGNPINTTTLGPCTAPNQATGGRNGRLRYTAGGNTFGGTMTTLRKVILQNGNNIGGGLAMHTVQVSGWTSQPRLDAIHRTTATIPAPLADTAPIVWVAGAANSFVQTNPVEPFQVTQPVAYTPTNGTIIQTAGPIIPQTTPPVPAGTLSSTGFPFTTGTVTVSHTQFNGAFFTEMGFDNRDASGQGTIQLVAGGLAKAPLGFAFQRLSRLTMAVHVPEPASALALSAGIALLLVLGARARRR